MNTQYHQKIEHTISYDVFFTTDLFSAENDILHKVIGEQPCTILFFLDRGVELCWPHLREAIEAWGRVMPSNQYSLAGIEIVEGGEPLKNAKGIIDDIGRLVKALSLCRHSYIIAIGGGAVLDVIGFTSSIIHRGIRFIRIPTTTLSMNDSGVGIKNGINRFSTKNFYGLFNPPLAVINDFRFLETLPYRVWVSGIAEAFKVGVIKDVTFLNLLLANLDRIRERDKLFEKQIIIRCAELHMAHIASGGDPLENGSSRPLDFGHWAAHKLESMTGFQLLHGEAVAIGMAIDLSYASLLGLIDPQNACDIITALHAVGLPVYHQVLDEQFLELLHGLQEFREHLGGELTLAMPSPLGNKVDIHSIDQELLQAAVSRLR